MNTITVDAVAELVERRPSATFGELQQLLGDEGEYILLLGGQNLVIGADLSEDFLKVVVEALEGDRIHIHAMDFTEAILVYGYDGLPIPAFPPARRVPKKGYKEPHWLPVALYLGGKCPKYNCQCPAWQRGTRPEREQ